MQYLNIPRTTNHSYIIRDFNQDKATNNKQSDQNHLLMEARVSEELKLLEQQQHFELVFLTILETCAKTIAEIVSISSTQDLINKISEELFQAHDQLINKIRESANDDALYIQKVIQASAGNCYEMAVILRTLLDLCLTELLTSFGYPNLVIKARVNMAATPPNSPKADHLLVIVECNMISNNKFIADAWSQGGRAWRFDKGMEYFRTRAPDKFSQPDMEFFPIAKNGHYKKPEYLSTINKIFEKEKVKERLQMNIQKNEFLQTHRIIKSPESTFTQ